ARQTSGRPAAGTTAAVAAGLAAGVDAGTAARGDELAPVPSLDEELRRFYADPAVRLRIGEYLGDRRDRSEEMTAGFFCHPARALPSPPWPAGGLGAPPEARLEAARSLWDRASLIAHLDLEHVHFDRPWQPLAEPERSELLQRPLVEALGEALAEHGLAPLHL